MTNDKTTSYKSNNSSTNRILNGTTHNNLAKNSHTIANKSSVKSNTTINNSLHKAAKTPVKKIAQKSRFLFKKHFFKYIPVK